MCHTNKLNSDLLNIKIISIYKLITFHSSPNFFNVAAWLNA